MALSTIEVFLDKAQRHAGTDEAKLAKLLTARLVPDMKDFTYQVQSASDYVKAGAAWLSGQTPPKFQDSEKTIEQLRDRVCKTLDFVRSVDAEQYVHAAEQRVKLTWAPGKAMQGESYLVQMVVPNVYFHVAMAYAILRTNGVDVGKMDFLGQIDFVPV